MLAIRMQRVGRKGHAMYRLAVQESQRHPSSGRVIAYVGTYDPHTKDAKVQVETAQKYLDNGAQPTPRVVKLLKAAGVKLPNWVKQADSDKQKTIRNTEKLRKNRPVEEVAATEKATEVVEAAEEAAPEAPAEASDAPVEEPAAEEKAIETPAAEPEVEEATEESPAEPVEETPAK